MPVCLFLVIAACGGRVSGVGGSAASGSIVSASGMVASGSVVGGGGSVGAAPNDGGPEGGNVVVPGAIRSAGCGKAWSGATGQWVSQPAGCAQGRNNQGTPACQAVPPGSTVPATATMGSPEYRGWWVLVPTGYDPSKPYTVIYSAAGWGDPNFFHGGADGFPYQTVDGDNAILVGLDYDTYSTFRVAAVTTRSIRSRTTSSSFHG